VEVSNDEVEEFEDVLLLLLLLLLLLEEGGTSVLLNIALASVLLIEAEGGVGVRGGELRLGTVTFDFIIFLGVISEGELSA
jgi:hypothetical protein